MQPIEKYKPHMAFSLMTKKDIQEYIKKCIQLDKRKNHNKTKKNMKLKKRKTKKNKKN